MLLQDVEAESNSQAGGLVTLCVPHHPHKQSTTDTMPDELFYTDEDINEDFRSPIRSQDATGGIIRRKFERDTQAFRNKPSLVSQSYYVDATRDWMVNGVWICEYESRKRRRCEPNALASNLATLEMNMISLEELPGGRAPAPQILTMAALEAEEAHFNTIDQETREGGRGRQRERLT